MTIIRDESVLFEKVKMLPKKQQLTDRTLVLLERRVARSSRKNEEMLNRSEKLAERSLLPRSLE